MRGKKQRVNQLLLAVIIISSIWLLAGCGSKVEQKQAQESTITVSVATAANRDIYGSTTYSGRLKASTEVEVISKTSQRVVAINVKEGQAVSAGQTIMTLDSSSLRSSINKAQAQIVSAQASVTSSQVNLDAARTTYERTKNLYAQEAVTKADLDSAENQYNSSQAQLVSAQAAVTEAQASLQAIQDEVGYCSVTAPVSGIVGRIDVAAGDYVTVNETVAVISNPQEMQVTIPVGEADIGKIQLHSQVSVYIKSISEKAFSGTVTSIASVLEANSDMYPVTVTIDNAEGKIKSGMYAQVLVDTSGAQNALCIPLSAVIPTGGVNVVYTVTDKNQAKRVEVNTGINDDTYVQILSGLKAGEKVVTSGNTFISDGSLLKTKDEEGK